MHLSTLFCLISGFRSDVHEICDHLVFYTASSGNPISTFQAKLSDPSTRVSVERQFHADESEPIGGDGTDRLSRNVRTKLPRNAV